LASRQGPWALAAVGGWNVSGIASHYSGRPVTAFLNADVANVGTVSGRYTQLPELVGNPKLSNPTPQKWFNTAAFAVPAQYTYGNAGRNLIRADTTNNVDFSLYKQWPFLENRGQT
jgi:hypothetical protein